MVIYHHDNHKCDFKVFTHKKGEMSYGDHTYSRLIS
jgi:hypothetical protein